MGVSGNPESLFWGPHNKDYGELGYETGPVVMET